ncbi:MAG: EAL domain-containing protein [Actinobacteria bacterium]|nr:EAL domain-containing protein [Actinomycetota bacterium]
MSWAAGDCRLFTEVGGSRRSLVILALQIAGLSAGVLALRRWSAARHAIGYRAGVAGVLDHQTTWDAALREREREEHARRVRRVLSAGDTLEIVFQPVVSLPDGVVVEVEALSRFHSEPSMPPDAWFSEAHTLGMGAELELQALEQALRVLPSFPPEWSVALNLSATTMTSGALADVLAPWPLERISLELTEHEEILDYERLREALEPLRSLGLRLGVDDAGAGYSSMRHILLLRPDFVKLDRSVVSGIHNDLGKRALATSLVSFAREIGAAVVAEGVEEADEVIEVMRLGADFAQGYFFDRPSASPERRAYGIPPSCE